MEDWQMVLILVAGLAVSGGSVALAVAWFRRRRGEDQSWFQNATGGIKAIVVTVGVILGGVWTLYLFTAENSRESSAAELQAKLVEVEIAGHAAAMARLEVENTRQFSLDVALSTGVSGRTTEGKPFVVVHAKIHNVGGRYVEFNLLQHMGEPKRMLTVAEVSFDENQNEIHRNVRKIAPHFEEFEGLGLNFIVDVAAGAILSIPFLVPVGNPGPYFVEFKAEFSERLAELVAEVTGYDWSSVIATDYFLFE